MLPYMPWKSLMVADFQKTTNAVTLKDYEKSAIEHGSPDVALGAI